MQVFTKLICGILVLLPLYAHSDQISDAESQTQSMDMQNNSDAKITAAVQAQLAANTDLNFFGINVSTQDGVVYLSGNVRMPNQVYRATEIAQGVPGVKSVDATKLYAFEKF